VYWKPVFNLLEGSFEVVLANAHHMKAVPGWKTDVKDCTDREPPRAWAHPKLHPAATDPRLARSHATSEEPHPGSGPGRQPRAQAAGDGQHQAREHGRRRAGHLGPCHVGRACRRKNRSAAPGEAGEGQPHQSHPICFRNSSNGNRSPGQWVRLTSLWRMIRLSGML